MTSKHTPGPWHRNIKPARKYPMIFAGRNTHVAAVKSDGLADDTVEANCALIAAAPDLLAALQAAESALQSFIDGNTSPNLNACNAIADMARAAIAKAEGL